MRFDNLTSEEIREICQRVDEDMRAERAGKPPRKRFFDDWPSAQFTDEKSSPRSTLHGKQHSNRNELQPCLQCTNCYRKNAITRFLLFLLIDNTLEQRQRELEQDFFATKVGRQLDALQAHQKAKRTWRSWLADVSGNLVVNFVTILVIAALLFGFRGLDTMLGEFGRDSGVLHK